MLNSPYRVRHIYPHGPAIESCDEYWNNIKYDKEELKIMLYDMPLSEGHFNKRCLNSDELLERIEDLRRSGEHSSSDFFVQLLRNHKHLTSSNGENKNFLFLLCGCGKEKFFIL